MTSARAFGPEDIRALRGDRSRVAFAKLAGVSPLTVYRWELPDGAPEARRPRGKVAARLATIAGAPRTASALDDAEQLALLPLLERLTAGDLRHVEGELLALMASGRLGAEGRALAAQALARTVLLARADTSAAFAAIAPLLADVSRLPEFVALQVHVTAALVFSWPDGRFFDVGKVNAHLASAERLLPSVGTPDARFLLDMARVVVALAAGAAEGVAEAVARAGALERTLASPMLSTLLRETEGYVAMNCGQRSAAEAAFREVALRGAVPSSQVRTLAQLALLSMQDARAPQETLAFIERARAVARDARLQPGLHSLMLDNLEGASLYRLGRFADAVRVLHDSLEIATDLRWTFAYAALMLARVHLTTGDSDALRALAARLARYDGPAAVGTTRAIGAWLDAVADGLDAPKAEHARLDAFEAIERDADWADLRGEVLLLGAMVAAETGTAEQHDRALRAAERHFDRFPSILATATLRRLRGEGLARRGQLQEARQQLEAALGTLVLAGDVTEAARARLALAQIAAARGEAGARAQLEEQRAEVARLGLRAPADLGRARTGAAPVTKGDRLVVSLRRLAVRGLSPALIRRELVTLLAEHTPGASASLEELDSGGVTLLERAGSDAPAERWIDLDDGDRKLRLGLGGPITSDERAGLAEAIAGVAGLALELASLRLAGAARAPAPAPELEPPDLPGFVSASPSMRQLKSDLARLSGSRATVIITGESGSGKEVVARALHERSTRADRPYIAFNCAAVPRDLFEAQLFGCRKGAFTGATSDQPGVLRAADAGTVLLDEIGELPLDVQPKLLRFLENGEVLPLGERKPVRIDVRVIAATYRDLAELVRERRFREDLFYRLHVVPLHVPPLRERPDDIIPLARHFIAALTPPDRTPPLLAPDAVAALHAWSWPGNVRELRNVLERSLAFAPLPPVLGAEHLRFGATRASRPR